MLCGLKYAYERSSVRGRHLTRPSTLPRRGKSIHTSRSLKDNVYAFGDNSELQCARYKRESVLSPQKISDLPADIDVKGIFCNWKSNLLLKGDGQVLAWGVNNFTQMGLTSGRRHDIASPEEISALSTSTVHHIAPGRAHTAFIINDPHQVITVGFAESGQVGNGVFGEESFSWPQLISALNGLQIIDIKSGLDHSVALSANGDAYAWGVNTWGQVGSEASETSGFATPQKIAGIPPLKSIFSGCDHSGGIDKQGRLWVWGSNLQGQLGLDESPSAVDFPRVTPVPIGDSKLKQVVGGGVHTIALTDSGELWVTGRSDEGSLGLGEDVKDVVQKWTKLDFFERNNIPVKSIHAGYGHSIVLTEDDKLYVWGLNDFGQLGLGDKTSRFEPVQNEFFVDRRIKGVTCGQIHTIVWSEYSIL